MRTTFYLALIVALCAMACSTTEDGGSTARVEGRITDAGGAQTRSFGGDGTTSAATLVRASAVGAGGSLELLAEAQVEAGARYALDLPAYEESVILQAIDASGEVLAAAILESSGAPDETVVATPIDSESSLEAAIYLEMMARGAEPDPIDLRARVTSELALAVRIAHDRGDDISAAITALADAAYAAQETEIAMYARAGASVSQADLFAAELPASIELSAALDASADAQGSYDAFFAELASAATGLGASPEAQGRAEAAASASFRATIEARVTDAPIREAALLAAASIEARAHEQAMLSLMTAGEAGADVQARAASAAARLRSEVSAAATASAAAQAYATFAAEIRGDAQVDGSIVGVYLGVDLLTGVTAQAAVDASATAAGQLDAAIDAAASTSGALDARAVAAEIAAAYGTYFEAVSAQQATLATISDDVHASTAVDLLFVADASLR